MVEEDDVTRTFDDHWQWISARSDRIVTVQECAELRHVYELMLGCECETYLEIGAAEGNSLYALGHAVQNAITYIDIGEAHTAGPRAEAIAQLGKTVHPIIGDSTLPRTAHELKDKHFDCVLIDGGHDFATVLSDSILYATRARKYVFWHDIQLPEVKEAVEWFTKRWHIGIYSTFINSDRFGYGIMKVVK